MISGIYIFSCALEKLRYLIMISSSCMPAAPLRMMCMYAAVPFHCECYDVLDKPGGGWDLTSWFSKKPDLKAKNPLMVSKEAFKSNTARGHMECP